MVQVLKMAGVGVIASIGAGNGGWLSAAGVFALVMLTDYVTGILAAKREAIERPEDTTAGLSSRKGILGIIKKLGYMFMVVSAFLLDFLLEGLAADMGIALEAETFFGGLTLLWLILNELLSIIENIGRMGVPVPVYLKKIVTELKEQTDERMGE